MKVAVSAVHSETGEPVEREHQAERVEIDTSGTLTVWRDFTSNIAYSEDEWTTMLVEKEAKT